MDHHSLRVVTIAVLLCLFVSSGFSQVRSSAKPLSKDDVVKLLMGDVSSRRVEELALERGINFPVTVGVETSLRRAGADDHLLAALRKLTPSLTSAPATPDTTYEPKLEMGDMGVMGGPIARNQDELQRLASSRKDRDYHEFVLSKLNIPERVGPIQLTLTEFDPIQKEYTLTILVDERALEKKNRTVGTLLQFYVKGSARMAPYEIVVLSMTQKNVTGYLSVPKAIINGGGASSPRDAEGENAGLEVPTDSPQLPHSVMGTLIARNHDEVQQLRRMGQRDYLEFTLRLNGGLQKIGPVQAELMETDVGARQVAVAMVVDDKRFEKKSRSVNQPIFFYTGGLRLPCELVINKVSKNGAEGYLSVPKTQ
jgi:hypothetical protein